MAKFLNTATKLFLSGYRNNVTKALYQSSVRSSGSDSVSCFSIPDRSKLDADILERINKEEEKAGFLANVFKVFSRRPEEFRGFMHLYDNIMGKREGGSVTRAEKELIVTATSAQSGCLYCTVAHGALHRIYSKNPLVADQVSVNKSHADLTPRECAILDFALKLSTMEPIDAEKAELSRHGLDEEDIWDIGAVTAFFSMSNRYAHLAKMMPNHEFYTLGRESK